MFGKRERRTKPQSITPDHVEPVDVPAEPELVIDLTAEWIPGQRAVPTD